MEHDLTLDSVAEEIKGGLDKLRERSVDEKRGVPRLHENMLPGNSFPQICVVSVAIMCKFAHRHKST
jgi:hypothetical protein